MSDTVVLDGEVSLSIPCGGEINLVVQCDGESGIYTAINDYVYPIYTGETTVTPSAETQTLSTSGTTLTSDITIDPIPSNYGLITWDGVTLTVS